MNQKYILAIPLYRQEQEWNRLDIKINRQNLSNWIMKGADLLKPLEEELKKTLLNSEILHADETTLEVLNEPGRDAHQNSYMWLYQTPVSSTNKVVLYDYQIGRSSIFPINYLKDWKGSYLCCDGYKGYEKIPDIKLAGCYAHLRRYFHEAYKTNHSKEAKACLDYLGEIFRLEKIGQEKNKLNYEEILAMRKEKYPQILEKFYLYLDELEAKTLPKSLLGRAIYYAKNQKSKFFTMLEDGRIDLTNNLAERSIKMFVIGRKNFLFSNTVNGATGSARIYSIMQTAIANNLKPMQYLEYVFEKIQENPNITPKELVPWSDTIAESCKKKNTNS